MVTSTIPHHNVYLVEGGVLVHWFAGELPEGVGVELIEHEQFPGLPGGRAGSLLTPLHHITLAWIYRWS